MKEKYISINTINKVMEFVKMATMVDGDIICKRGKYIVDGKSILGIFSIDISKGFLVEYPADATDFEKYIIQFEVDKVED